MPGFELSKECFNGIGAAYDTFRGFREAPELPDWTILTRMMQEAAERKAARQVVRGSTDLLRTCQFRNQPCQSFIHLM